MDATNAQTSSTSKVVGSISATDPDALPMNSMKMATVGETRVAVIRTSKGVHALDNACPHQGYGLVTGALDLDPNGTPLVTCQWHNWKFRAEDGVCLVGEENVACHRVDIAESGEVTVTVTEPTTEERLEQLWPSLRRGLEKDYVGQMSRDSVRLLDAGAAPADIMAEALRIGSPKAEDGVGHEMALAADCLHLAELWEDDERALPLIQGLAGISEVTRDRPVQPVPAADPSIAVADAIEAEDVDAAMAGVMGLLASEADSAVVRHQFIEAVTRHHLASGHGAIFTQKAFELLDRIGWNRAPELLPHVAKSITYMTREDTLPYMRKPMKQLATMDFGSLAESEDRADTGWDPTNLAGSFLSAEAPPLTEARDAIRDGAGVEGLLDAVSLAVSERLLRHNLGVEFNLSEGFGWLSITHGLTYARAARWAWQMDPGPHTARLAMYAAWMAWDTGRAERRHGIGPMADPVGAMADAATGDPQIVAGDLARSAMDDRGGTFIVVAHLVKTTQAALEEAQFTGSRLPLVAAARFVHAPRHERFVASTVQESLNFIRTGKPPVR